MSVGEGVVGRRRDVHHAHRIARIREPPRRRRGGPSREGDREGKSRRRREGDSDVEEKEVGTSESSRGWRCLVQEGGGDVGVEVERMATAESTGVENLRGQKSSSGHQEGVGTVQVEKETATRGGEERSRSRRERLVKAQVEKAIATREWELAKTRTTRRGRGRTRTSPSRSRGCDAGGRPSRSRAGVRQFQSRDGELEVEDARRGRE